MVLLQLALTIFFCLLLIKATQVLLEVLQAMVASRLLARSGLVMFALAFATSLPELFIALSAAIQGQGELVIGNVVGSNIANISLVLGAAAVLAGSLKASGSFIKQEVYYVFLAGSLPLLLLSDGVLSRFEALLLLFVYGLYHSTIAGGERRSRAKKDLGEIPLTRRILISITKPRVERQLGMLLLAGSLVIFSADMVVRLSLQLAEASGIPVFMVGLFLLGMGTSLPELLLELKTIRRKQMRMAFGNILGSVVTNSTLVVALPALLQPIKLSPTSHQSYLLTSMVFVALFAVFWLFVWSKKTLQRWEGAVLIGVYIVFVLMQLQALSKFNP